MSLGLARSQRAFTAALFDPAAAAPAFLRDASSMRAASAFAVYRNNVASSLINVLMARFPVIVRLIGDDAFRGLALRFIALYPPRSPVMMTFGGAFPEFLRGLSETSMADYLADIARLEVARGHAYHAADAEPVAPERFAGLAPDELPASASAAASVADAVALAISRCLGLGGQSGWRRSGDPLLERRGRHGPPPALRGAGRASWPRAALPSSPRSRTALRSQVQSKQAFAMIRRSISPPTSPCWRLRRGGGAAVKQVIPE